LFELGPIFTKVGESLLVGLKRRRKPANLDVMAKGQQRGNREAKKPKKEKAKVIAAQPSRKEVGLGDEPSALIEFR
jgi:hypothetical protein